MAACLQKRVGWENWSNYTKLSRSDVVHELVLTHSPPAGHSMVMQFMVSPGNCVCKLLLWANKAVNCVMGRAESVLLGPPALAILGVDAKRSTVMGTDNLP